MAKLRKIVQGGVVQGFLMVLIMANLLMIILESFDEYATTYQTEFALFEVVSVSIFSVEYILYIITSANVLRYLFSFSSAVDLVSILPFYLPMFLPGDWRALRALRLVRFFKLFRIGRYSNSLQLLSSIFKEKREDLVVTASFCILLIFISSVAMYQVEHEAQPEHFPNIVASLWWAVATFTTIGYGDVYPITALGRLLCAVIALIGIGLVALPTAIISSSLIEKITRKPGATATCQCPSCGHRFAPAEHLAAAPAASNGKTTEE